MPVSLMGGIEDLPLIRMVGSADLSAAVVPFQLLDSGSTYQMASLYKRNVKFVLEPSEQLGFAFTVRVHLLVN